MQQRQLQLCSVGGLYAGRVDVNHIDAGMFELVDASSEFLNRSAQVLDR
jgi:hypothetical protein